MGIAVPPVIPVLLENSFQELWFSTASQYIDFVERLHPGIDEEIATEIFSAYWNNEHLYARRHIDENGITWIPVRFRLTAMGELIG